MTSDEMVLSIDAKTVLSKNTDIVEFGDFFHKKYVYVCTS